MGKTLTMSAWFLLAGALAGILLATWIAPGAIAWYFEPPVEFGVSCGEPIRWALHRLRNAQLLGMFAGGVVSVAIYLSLRRRSGSEADDRGRA